ncbi:MAG: ATP-binding protein [Planctomycetota bacterium]|nr:ATP-binding protein [Planctomycetota bacterium]
MKGTLSISEARAELSRLRDEARADYGRFPGGFVARIADCLAAFEAACAAGNRSLEPELAMSLVLRARHRDASLSGADAMALVERARPLLEAFGLIEDHMLGCLVVADVLIDTGDLAAAQVAAERAEALHDRLPSQGSAEASILVLRGRLARRRGDQAGAMQYFERARACCIQRGARGMLMRVTLNLGVLHYERRELRRATEFHEQVLALALEERDPQRTFLGNLRLNLGLIQLDSEGFSEAASHFEDALQWLEPGKDTYMRLRAKLGLGKAIAALGRHDAAAFVAGELAERASTWIEQPGAVDVAADLCELLWKLGRKVEVHGMARLAIAHAGEQLSWSASLVRLRAWRLRAGSSLGDDPSRALAELELLLQGPAEASTTRELPNLVLEVAVEVFEQQGDYRRALLHQRLREQRFVERMRGLLGHAPVPREEAAAEGRDRLVADLVRHLRQLEETRGDLEREAAERRVQAQQREQAEAHVESMRRHETVGRLAGSVAHDFNNLLTVVLSNVSLLEDGEPDAERRACLDSIRTAGEGGAALVRRLLALGRPANFEPTVVCFQTFLQDSLPVVRSILGSGIELDLGGVESEGAVMGDANQLQSVLVNLLLNAREAMGGRGQVRLERRLLRGAEARAQGLVGDPPLVGRLRVSDTGPGIPADLAELVFEPFFTTRGATGGTGIGLASARDILLRHGGDLRLHESGPNGTTFEVLLPAIDASEAADPAPARAPEVIGRPGPAGGSDLSGRCILLAEDNEAIRSLARRHLEACGARVLAAQDGRAALALFDTLGEHERPDLVVTDMVMPNLGGRGLLAQLRERGFVAPALFISAYTELQPDQLPGDSFLAKPFRMAELARRVAELLPTHRTS